MLQNQNIQAILMVLIGGLLFNVADGFAKYFMAEGFPAVSLVTIPNLISFVFFYILLAFKRKQWMPIHTPKWRLHILRGLIITGVAWMVMTSVHNIPLADFYGIIFMGPLYAAILAGLFLKEKITRLQWGTLLIGFLGILIIVGPSFSQWNIGYLTASIQPLLFAASVIVARMIGNDEEPYMFSLMVGLTIVTLNLPLLLWHGMPVPTATQAVMLVAYGLVLGTALLLFSYGFAKASSTGVIAPFQYMQIIWATLIGWFIFGEIPGVNTIIGSIIVAGCGLFMVYAAHSHTVATRAIGNESHKE